MTCLLVCGSGDVYLANLDSASGAIKNVKDVDETNKVAWTLLNSNNQSNKVKQKAPNHLKIYDEWECCRAVL